MARKQKATETEEGGAVSTMKPPADTAQAFAQPADRYEPALALDLLRPSKSNPRKRFNQAYIEQLAESLKATQIQPILVRPIREKSAGMDDQGQKAVDDLVDIGLLPERPIVGYEIVVGECRYRAAKLAGIPALMATVRELTNVQVLKIQLRENRDREDIDPLEEAAAYQDLMKMTKWDAKQLAEDQKVSLRHVYSRLALLKLPKPISEALAEGKITAVHAEIIARLPNKELQEKALSMAWVEGPTGGDYDSDDVVAHVPIRTFEEIVKRDLLRELTAAPWDLDDAMLAPKCGACSVCPKRSLAESPLLADQTKDCCLDSKCWGEKSKALIMRKATELEQNGTVVLLAETYEAREAYGAQRAELYRECKQSADSIMGLYVDGTKAGQATPVTIDKKTVNHLAECGYDDARQLQKTADVKPGEAQKVGEPKTSMKQRRAQLELRRCGNVVDYLKDSALQKFSAKEFVDLHGDLWLFHLNALVCSFGTSSSLGSSNWGNDGFKKFQGFCGSSGTKLAAYEPLAEKIWPSVRTRIQESLQYHTLANLNLAAAKSCTELLGLKWDDLYLKACVAIPEPKSWNTATNGDEKSKPAVKSKATPADDKISAKQIKKNVAAAKKTKTPKAKKKKK